MSLAIDNLLVLNHSRPHSADEMGTGETVTRRKGRSRFAPPPYRLSSLLGGTWPR
jgi:hypothetical protein